MISGLVAVPATAIIKMAEVADWLTNGTPALSPR
jgi:hypothetical protein